MIASAMRFAGPVSEQNFAKADAWADASIGILLPRIYQGFGALQLMNDADDVLALIRPITDGGRYGFHTIDENSFRLQLPCDQASFLGNERVTTEPLFPCPNDSQNIASKNTYHASLDMSAYLLRTAAARRRALHFAFRASHEEGAIETMTAELSTLEADIESVIKGLPKRFHFNTDNVCIHRDRLTMFILMHILRHNLFIALGRAALLIHQRDPARSDLMIQVRRKRILHALPIAGLVSEGLRAGIAFDPHIGVHAYVALEILLFEPRRLAETDSHVKLKAPEITEAIPHLLMVIRELASRSDIMNHLKHIEAVHRLLRCDYKHLVNQTDINAFRSEYRIVGQDAAEYDFRDFRWARLERILRGAQPSANYNGDEVLLEYRTGAEAVVPSTAPSPQLDAMDVNSSLSSSCTATHPPESDVWSTPALQYVNESGTDQHLVSDWGAGDSEAQRYPHSDLSLDWPWLLEESGHLGYQTGDPTIFWSQLERI
ncbi:uncharacterized protein N7511_000500 [Penicillium nucicola]|uniref:uncharacterized protein n=1 Tax=Penicillium nucicola TaxID=1850975 RepID=UPI0025456862|nr:uncharacterized protein N7511_000500 [Penicillium nucicola]KAJ5775489.1 hypothetical protein N7511_000500 [Penicillium nucicola]